MAFSSDTIQTIVDIVDNTMDSTLAHNNANKASERIPTMRDMVAGEVSKALADRFIPKDVIDAHHSGDIHYHDLDYAPLFPMFNCMLIDLEGMLTQGFKMGNAEIETPKSIGTATSITAQIIAQVASHIYGGNTIDRIDEVLAPYVKLSYKKWYSTFQRLTDDDEKAAIEARLATEKETYDAFQGLEYEINTLHTANGQTPFCTLGFGLGTSWESRLIQTSILRVRLRGLGRTGRTAVFPKLVFGLREGTNLKKGDVNYDIKQLAVECASKRMYPDVLSYDALVSNTGSYKAPMGCRSFLSDHADGHAGRNNLGVTSINLPRIAIEAGDLASFWKLLDERIAIAKRALDSRVDRLRNVKASVAPILYTEGACGVRLKPDDNIFSIFESGRASISLGYIGIHETVQELLGTEPHKAEHAKRLALNIVQKLRDAVDTWKAEDGLGWGLYSTPSESLCDRFARLDKEKFLKAEPVWGKGYYTNSFHQDVLASTSPFDKLDYEAPFQKIANGGFISYVELPRVQESMQKIMVETVWDYAYDNVAYLGVNIPIDVCHDCGHSGEADRSMDGYHCAHCGSSNMEVTMRVCGYLGAPNSRPFIDGKQHEVLNRVKHT
ncbi:anaerobic ribonucleoside-triphosphate reductase [Vibrio phage 1.152.O._10N.222.46.E1]|uniref:Anaerobic ribonucleoside-triphosphate reductase n=5 Tax=Nahantvirus 49C7 TaxID=2846601 RepID=A0A2I7RBB0_9CAUD|nr:NrdD-like anaerobic ribonucleotide reductase large subunit [Vibrio phage 1.026.O._10N.222.49.C7]AUR82523.1 anaerobic ribonucleoside-triphosphate reductase [Vibrio phage 1.025.O._10N.222.46.B6]AUR90773.1 anaerobic ribonucleoside-triphosphate reductase [Vibrio phage 1.150.O._10N.222.46.A6]AUR90946.1 anaerobic ribonucleoside-triphosphate reductase [Vibrio phage 1.152.O._10N.222.46.E1]AUS02414.1 anaerobic ribonucleoside-triphosphate reductase [Vibrio phage 2.130.O._10N.222.46.C2]AUR82631.1 anae